MLGKTRKELLAEIAILKEQVKNIKTEEAVAILEKLQELSQTCSYKELEIIYLRMQVLVNNAKIDLDYCNIEELQAMVRAGKLSYVELVQMYLARIALYNDNTIAINAIRAINEHALEEAAACDLAVRENPELAQGIFGMPVLIKDNIGSNKNLGMPTTAGSIALAHNFVDEDAYVLQQIRKEGIVLLGKTNLSEFANFITNGVVRANGVNEPMPSGYSTLGGQVLCPYKPGVINPGGSSSGSGAGCAAGLAALTIGTETSGSILNPSTANSLVGLKPTVGIISRNGIIPLSHSQDTAGPMCRNVTDVAYLMNAMKGFDKEDVPVTAGCDNALVTEEYWQANDVDFVACLDKNGLKGKRLGIYVWPEADMEPLFNETLELLKELGAEILLDKDGKTMDAIMNKQAAELPWVSELLHLDFAADMDAYFKKLSNHNISLTDSKIASLEDVIAYNKCYPERLVYGQTILERCATYDVAPQSKDMQRAQQVHDQEIAFSRTQILDKLFAEYKLDALISFNGGTTRIAAKASYPSITVPAGYRDQAHDQFPINLQFTGQAFDDGKLIAMAYAFESATKARRAPGRACKLELQKAIEEATVCGFNGKEYKEALAVLQNNFALQGQVDAAVKKLLLALSQ